MTSLPKSKQVRQVLSRRTPRARPCVEGDEERNGFVDGVGGLLEAEGVGVPDGEGLVAAIEGAGLVAEAEEVLVGLHGFVETEGRAVVLDGASVLLEEWPAVSVTRRVPLRRESEMRRASVWKPMASAEVSGVTGEVEVRAAGRTAQDASSGSWLLRPMRMRRTSGRRAVISRAAPEMVAARPLGRGRDFSTRERVRVWSGC